MKYPYLLLILVSFISCASESKNELSKDEIIANSTVIEEHYTFKDGTKIPKSDWLNPTVIQFFTNSVYDTEFAKGVADCFMIEVSKKHSYNDIKPLMGSASKDEIIKMNRLFYELGLNNIFVNCAKNLVNDYKLDKKFTIQSERQRIIFIDQIKMQFESSEDFNEILPMIDENNFYNCVADNILETFTIKEIVSNTAYNSEEYGKIIDNCLLKSVKK